MVLRLRAAADTDNRLCAMLRVHIQTRLVCIAYINNLVSPPHNTAGLMHALGNAAPLSDAPPPSTHAAASNLEELDASRASKAAGFVPTAARVHRSSTRALAEQGVARAAGAAPAGLECVGPPHLVNAWKQGSTGNAADTTKGPSGAAMASEFLGKLQASLQPVQYQHVRKAIAAYREVRRSGMQLVCVYAIQQGGVTIQALTNSVVNMLRGGPAEHLLDAFGGFLPKKDRAAYAERLTCVCYACDSATTVPDNRAMRETQNGADGAPQHRRRPDENAQPQGAAPGWRVRADSIARRPSPAPASVPAPAPAARPSVPHVAVKTVAKTTTVQARPLVQRGAPTGKGKPCPVCKTAEAVDPWRAPCGHIACYTCWLSVLSGMKCPTCSAPTRKKQLTKVYFG